MTTTMALLAQPMSVLDTSEKLNGNVKSFEYLQPKTSVIMGCMKNRAEAWAYLK